MSDLLIALAEMIAKAAAAKKSQAKPTQVPPPVAVRAAAKPQAVFNRQKNVKPQARRPAAAPQAKAAAAQLHRTDALATPSTPEVVTQTRPPAPGLINFLRPKALRSQFIVTEIFQPPVSLRPDRFFD